MMKSAPALTNSLALPQLDRSIYIFIPILLALIAYCLPWVIHPSTALTFNAYDLAEWASLPPSVRSENPVLLATLLLRMQLTVIALMISLLAGNPFKTLRWWICTFALLVLVVAQLPPFEYFLDQGGDMNYGQQFTLAVVTVIAGIVGLSNLPGRWHRLIIIGLAVVSGVTAIFGYALAFRLMESFNLVVRYGVGIYLFIICTFAIALIVRYSPKQTG
jgi:hypothetical protein